MALERENIRKWYLISKDQLSSQSRDFNMSVEGQFIAENLTHDISSNWSQMGALNREAPILQFTSGGLERIRFDTMLWAETKDQSIIDWLTALKFLVRRNEFIHRPPVCIFKIGSENEFEPIEVVVQSIGGIRILDITPDGRIRGARLSITLLKYIDYLATDRERTTVPASINYKTAFAKDGETFESTAKKIYKDPTLGINLRKVHPGIFSLTPGQLIKIYPIDSSFMQLSIEPDSVVLRILQQTAIVRNQFFELRSKPYIAPFIKQ